MGVVYQARHASLKRFVALKMVLAGSHAGEHELARFRLEAEAVARLQHPNIVQIYEVGQQDGLPFLALKFVGGGSLARRLDGTPQSVAFASQMVETLARAVQSAHQRNIVHRDLKPANVLLEEDLTAGSTGSATTIVDSRSASVSPAAKSYVPKITDFGLAKQLDSEMGQTQSGAIMGTPSYMAPEQAEGRKDVGPAADIYALGAILYELLTGRPPFRAQTSLETIMQVVTDEPVSPRRLRPRLKRDLETICLKCLQKQPAKRYASALDLAEDLRRFQAGESIRARPAGAVERGWRWCRRNPYLAAASGLAAAALVAVFVFLVLFAEQQQATVKDQQQAALKLEKEQAQTKAALKNANQHRALLTLDRALGICERGELGEGEGDPHKGMLWLARALEIAPPEDERLQHVIRANLAGWRPAVRPLKRMVIAHGTYVVALAPDERILAGGRDQFALLWDLDTGQNVGQEMVHDGHVLAIAFSPDGKTLATGSADKRVRLWNTSTQALRLPALVHPDGVEAVAFAPDGSTLVTGCNDGKLRFWDPVTGAMQGELVDAGLKVSALAFSNDGQLLATGSQGEGGNDGYARLWEAAARRPLGQPLRTDRKYVGSWSLAFSPDGTTLATASGQGVFLWDTRTQQLQGPLSDEGRMRCVAISPDGKSCAAGGWTKNACFWDIATRHPIGSPLWHSYAVAAIHFRPDGRSLLTHTQHHDVREWEQPLLRYRSLSIPHQDSDQPRFISYGAGVTYGMRCLAISPDGKRALTSDWDQSACVLDLDSGRLLHRLTGRQGLVLAGCFSADGRFILTGNEGNSACFWDAATGNLIGTPWGTPGLVNAVAISADGQTAFTASQDGGVLWDTATGRRLGQPLITSPLVNSAVFSADGKTLWAGWWQDLQTWDLASRAEVGPPVYAHTFAVASVALSPNGQMLATASLDKTVRLWDSATRKPLGLPLIHKDRVQQVAFSPDNRMLVTACFDGTARLWDVATCKPIGAPLEHPSRVHAALFTPDGKEIVTRCEEPFVRRWKVPGLVQGDVDRIVLWAQVLVGMDLDADGYFHNLWVDDWQQRRQRLQELGGSPAPEVEIGLADR